MHRLFVQATLKRQRYFGLASQSQYPENAPGGWVFAAALMQQLCCKITRQSSFRRSTLG